MSAAVMRLGLAMHLGHQRAGRVEGENLAAVGVGMDRLRHAMRREDHRLLGVGDFVEFLDEDRALRLQPLDNVFVMDDLVADIDRRAIDAQSLLDRIDGADDAGAETARGRRGTNLQLGLARHRGL